MEEIKIDSGAEDSPPTSRTASQTSSLSVVAAPLVEPNQVFEPETNWLCCTTYKDASQFKSVIQHLSLTPVQKEIIDTRYLRILHNLQKRTRNHAIIYFIGHFVITVGSLFVPALLSIQNSDKEYALTGGAFNVQIYWAAFAISLLVTVSNDILTLFRIDKKYYFLNTILERLRSEGWQYMSLTGRYSGHLTPGKKPTHDNQFVHFTHYVEKIKMKQIEEEFYRTDEKSQAPTTAPTGTASSTPGTGNQTFVPMGTIDWYPPSPDKSIPSMTQHVPETIKNAYDSLVHIQSPLQRQSLTSSSAPAPPAPPVPAPPVPAPPAAPPSAPAATAYSVRLPTYLMERAANKAVTHLSNQRQ